MAQSSRQETFDLFASRLDHLSVRNNKILKKIILSRRGATLIELMAAVGVSVIVLLGASSALILTQNNQLSLSDKMKAEEEVNRVAFPLRHFLSMALNLIEVPGPLNGDNFDSNIGKIAKYNMANWVSSTGPGQIDVVAYFIRENFLSSTPLPAVATDRFPITTIFFQRPTVDKFGVLYINTSKSGPNLSPTDGDIKVSQIVDFQVSEIYSQLFGPSTYLADNDLLFPARKKMVTAVTMKIVTRNYFNGAGQSPVMAWCPPAFMPGNMPGSLSTPNVACKTNLPYKDTEKLFTFTLRNNVIGRSLTQRGTAANTGMPDGLMGPIFRRPFEATYFLSPALPPGAIR